MQCAHHRQHREHGGLALASAEGHLDDVLTGAEAVVRHAAREPPLAQLGRGSRSAHPAAGAGRAARRACRRRSRPTRSKAGPTQHSARHRSQSACSPANGSGCSLDGIAVQRGLLEVELAHHPAQHVVVDLARVAARDELGPLVVSISRRSRR